MANFAESTTIMLPGNTSDAFVYPKYTLVMDVRDWLFNRKKYEATPNMTVLPVLAVICFIVCVLLKIYKWYKDGIRMKHRGDLEYGDESEVNYGIIKAGDKNFCNVEIRSDTTSVYDTVTSFRHIGNGHAVGGCAHNYQDTVTSYKSLLMQRLDGAQYDSVKSYKAFLKQVTQNTDLAVEVKLLENYPVRSRSAEHCVLEEESSGLTEVARPFVAPELKVIVEGKKKGRHRRASGDLIGAMRKRSASNPTYHSSRTGAASLPSIRQTLSSDSSNEDEAFVSLVSDRRKLWEFRKKMARSCSGGRLAKGSPSQLGDVPYEVNPLTNRRRHFSADSARRPRKPLSSICHRAELKDLRESISETDPKAEEASLLNKQEDSSSENPDSSPTSCSTSVSSDAIESESEDEETQQITQLSVASDDRTASCEGIFDSCGELASSAEHLLGPVKCSRESVNGTHSLPIDTIETNGDTSSIPSSPVASVPSSISKSNTANGCDFEDAYLFDAPVVSTCTFSANDNNINNNNNNNSSHPCLENHSNPLASSPQEVNSNTQYSLSLPASLSNPANNNSSPPSSGPSSPSSSSLRPKDDDELARPDVESPDSSNARRVKRFHVTFISSDVSSPNSE